MYICTAKSANLQQSYTAEPSPAINVTIPLNQAIPVAVAAVAGISWYLMRQVKFGKEQRRSPSAGMSQFDAALEVRNIDFLIINFLFPILFKLRI